jgi:chaperonin GroES
MNVKPIHDRVIVRQKDADETSAGGILLPGKAGEKAFEGEVMAVGPGTRDKNGNLIALTVKVGDRILFGKYHGQQVKIEGEELIVMKEEDIFAVIE